MLRQHMRGVNGFAFCQGDDSQLELLRAVALCHPGWDRVAAATFVADDNSSCRWSQWKERIFEPVLRTEMERARLAAAAGDWRAVAVCDRGIDAALAPDLAAASQAAGAALMENYSTPKNERLWMRYRSLQRSREVPGHLAIVCAVRAVAFHLSPWALLSAYIFLEAKTGLSEAGLASWLNMVGDCMTGHRQGKKRSDLRAA